MDILNDTELKPSGVVYIDTKIFSQTFKENKIADYYFGIWN